MTRLISIITGNAQILWKDIPISSLKWIMMNLLSETIEESTMSDLNEKSFNFLVVVDSTLDTRLSILIIFWKSASVSARISLYALSNFQTVEKKKKFNLKISIFCQQRFEVDNPFIFNLHNSTRFVLIFFNTYVRIPTTPFFHMKYNFSS